MKILVIDVGGTHVKVLATGHKKRIEFPSGPKMTPAKMVAAARAATADWTYNAVSIGYPGPVVHGRPIIEPRHLAAGWVGFDFKKAFGRPVKIVNDAAMQALGSYHGGRMLFLGLGTGLGSAANISSARSAPSGRGVTGVFSSSCEPGLVTPIIWALCSVTEASIRTTRASSALASC